VVVAEALDMSMSWNALHFVRPDALWALLALPLLVAVWWLRRRRANVWRQTVDAHLLRHLLVGRDRRAWGGLILLLLGTAIAIVALAGPSWRQVAQPLWQTPSPLVVALDLSSGHRYRSAPFAPAAGARQAGHPAARAPRWRSRVAGVCR